MAAFRGMHVSPQNIAMGDFQESVTIRQTDRWTDAGQSDPYMLLCFPDYTKGPSKSTYVSFRMHFVLKESFELILLHRQSYNEGKWGTGLVPPVWGYEPCPPFPLIIPVRLPVLCYVH